MKIIVKIFLQEKEYLPDYKHLLKDDKALKYAMLNDYYFNLELAGLHILKYYNEALERNFTSPWVRTVSRYNGGWNNITYVNNIIRKIAIIETQLLPIFLKRKY